MSFLEDPKNRLRNFIPPRDALPMNGTPIGKPACIQCGSLLELGHGKKYAFSGKCFSCEFWVSDGDETEFDELEY